jgi:hypothetical protein
MQKDPIEADYGVIGGGATAMAFVDTLLTETDADIAIVDRHHRPGGHWNDAYSFVGLHQPAAFYGVDSRELSAWTKDGTGLNAGFYGLSSGAQVLAYFDQVMQERFLPSGRVLWFPKHEYSRAPGGSHQITSLLTGEVRRVIARKTWVNATHARTEVPSTRPPKYALAPGVQCIPLNDLPNVERPFASYAVVGAGKTGMDACVWLLQNGVDPDRIRWIKPRESWLLDRANFQPGAENFERTIGSAIHQFEAIANASSIGNLFEKLEQSGQLLRIDTSIAPTMYHCAVVSQAELSQLRRIKNVVRLGRLLSVEPTRIVLEKGSRDARADTLYVDCSASALQAPPSVPVFDDDVINLLMVRFCQPLFSASLIAFVESRVADATQKNALCAPVPSPQRPIDWLRMWGATLVNTARWRENELVSAWLAKSRLNSLNASLRGVAPDDAAKFALLQEMGAKARMAAVRIPELLATA